MHTAHSTAHSTRRTVALCCNIVVGQRQRSQGCPSALRYSGHSLTTLCAAAVTSAFGCDAMQTRGEAARMLVCYPDFAALSWLAQAHGAVRFLSAISLANSVDNVARLASVALQRIVGPPPQTRALRLPRACADTNGLGYAVFGPLYSTIEEHSVWARRSACSSCCLSRT